MIGAAFAVAALRAIESLPSAKVADGMADNGRHEPDRELIGQGLANLTSLLFGGMPAAGAIARTAVNVRSGARTRMWVIIHALALLRDHIAVFRLDGALFFGAAQHFLSILTQLSSVQVIILRLSALRVLDATDAQALLEIVTSLDHRGITVLLKGIHEPHRPMLASG